jgi:hypothetical protein
MSGCVSPFQRVLSFDAPEAACREADPAMFFPEEGDNVGWSRRRKLFVLSVPEA